MYSYPNRRTGAASPLSHFALCLLPFALAFVPSGCSLLHRGPAIEEKIGLIAVMPIERAEPVSATALPETPTLAPGAERVVTAEIYGVLSSSPRWRFVPDLTVSEALSHHPLGGDLESRARALGKAVGADGVLFGTVFRYRERVGSEFGTRQPAAVGFTLQLISVTSGKILWTGTFDQAQEALSTNLFNWWQFWRGGPRWFTAEEFTRIAVERLLDELAAKLQ
jgi:hypothetical protein